MYRKCVGLSIFSLFVHFIIIISLDNRYSTVVTNPLQKEEHSDEETKVWFLVLGFLHSVQGEFTDNVLETAVGPIFTGH
jgi:hypothetical protein